MKRISSIVVSALLILTAVIISAPSNGELETEGRLWTPGGWEYRLTTNPEYDQEPDIYEDRIVYLSRRSGKEEIYLHDLGNGTDSRIPHGFQGVDEPRIWGDRIVFTVYDGDDYEIYLFDITTWSGMAITDDAVDQGAPSVQGDHIVYSQYFTSNTDTLWFNISSGQRTTLESGSAYSVNPRVFYPFAVWTEVESTNMDIAICYMETGSVFYPPRGPNEELSSPDIHENIVTYAARIDGGAEEEIRFRNLNGGGMTHYIGQTSAYQRNPSVHENRIVWTNDGQRSNLMVNDIDKDLTRLAAASYQPKSRASIWGDRIVYSQSIDGNTDIYLVELDYDHDGIPDSRDLFMDNPNEHSDQDMDGIGDNTDPDSDNDGYLNSVDHFPMDDSEWSDFDNDGIGDNADTDDDNDGIPDDEDAEPLNQLNTVLEKLNDLMLEMTEFSTDINTTLSTLQTDIMETYSKLDLSLREKMESDLHAILVGLGFGENISADPKLLGSYISENFDLIATRVQELTDLVDGAIGGSGLNATQLQEILGYLEALQGLQGMIEDMEQLNEDIKSQTREIEDTRSISITLNVFILLMLILFSLAILLVLLRKPQTSKDEGFE